MRLALIAALAIAYIQNDDPGEEQMDLYASVALYGIGHCCAFCLRSCVLSERFVCAQLSCIRRSVDSSPLRDHSHLP